MRQEYLTDSLFKSHIAALNLDSSIQTIIVHLFNAASLDIRMDERKLCAEIVEKSNEYIGDPFFKDHLEDLAMKIRDRKPI